MVLVELVIDRIMRESTGGWAASADCLFPGTTKRSWLPKLRWSEEVLRFSLGSHLFLVMSNGCLDQAPNDADTDWVATKVECATHEGKLKRSR